MSECNNKALENQQAKFKILLNLNKKNKYNPKMDKGYTKEIKKGNINE